MILTVGNLKGGVGKTTLSVNLAIALAGWNRDVLLVDAEGTALGFTNLRTTTKGQAGYTAVSLHGANIRTQVRQLAGKYSDIVIDIGGEDATGSLRAALTVAGTVLIPVKPRSFDLWRTEQTAALVTEAREINESLRAVAVLNEADPQGKDNQEALDALAEIDGLEIAPVTIGRRKAFPNAASHGLSVLECKDDPKASAEMRPACQVFISSQQKRDRYRSEIEWQSLRILFAIQAPSRSGRRRTSLHGLGRLGLTNRPMGIKSLPLSVSRPSCYRGSIGARDASE